VGQPGGGRGGKQGGEGRGREEGGEERRAWEAPPGNTKREEYLLEERRQKNGGGDFRRGGGKTAFLEFRLINHQVRENCKRKQRTTCKGRRLIFPGKTPPQRIGMEGATSKGGGITLGRKRRGYFFRIRTKNTAHR